MSSAELAERRQHANRVLVVDDNEDAGLLLSKLFRRDGYEVGVLADHQAAIEILSNEAHPIGAVVVSFTTLGTGACLRLLDMIRHNPDPKVNQLRVLLVSEQPRQQIFCLQAGADAIVLRPYRSDQILRVLRDMVDRPDGDRVAYRRAAIAELKDSMVRDTEAASTQS